MLKLLGILILSLPLIAIWVATAIVSYWWVFPLAATIAACMIALLIVGVYLLND